MTQTIKHTDDFTIDLNADLGEYASETERKTEGEIMAYITSCNIACGGHTGTVETMRATLRAAAMAKLQCGAHPSYPDRENFGRQSLEIEPALLQKVLTEQIQTIKSIAEAEGIPLTHLKPHGALYNDAATSPSLATCITRAARPLGRIILVGPPNSALETAALIAGLPFAAEGFADRTYQTNGSLTPRHHPGAVIENQAERLTQALNLVRRNEITLSGAEGDKIIPLPVQTICLHGDSPGAVESARNIYQTLLTQGVSVRGLQQPI